jgi:hypothetical protein
MVATVANLVPLMRRSDFEREAQVVRLDAEVNEPKPKALFASSKRPLHNLILRLRPQRPNPTNQTQSDMKRMRRLMLPPLRMSDIRPLTYSINISN